MDMIYWVLAESKPRSKYELILYSDKGVPIYHARRLVILSITSS